MATYNEIPDTQILLTSIDLKRIGILGDTPKNPLPPPHLFCPSRSKKGLKKT